MCDKRFDFFFIYRNLNIKWHYFKIFIWDFINFGSGFLNDDQLFFLCADRFDFCSIARLFSFGVKLQSDLIVVFVVAFAFLPLRQQRLRHRYTHSHKNKDKHKHKQTSGKKPVEFTITTYLRQCFFNVFSYFVRLLGAFAIEAWLTQIQKRTHAAG